ncbi:MAG: hypothetical protein VR78_11930 [Hoeflea sp. BRH_c9]|nr:MAG: hypothetical protein VR78_11930 [Hoeflea sp. BRH_c9]
MLACHFFAVIGLLFACNGSHALELSRNGTRYQVDVPLPGGARFQSSGVDRKAKVNGVTINLRMIQDTYPDCKALVYERRVRVGKKGYDSDDESAVLTKRECQLHQWNSDTNEHIISHYIWMDICACYAAVHFSYPLKLMDRHEKVSAPINLALRRASSSKAQKTVRKDGFDEDWIEAIGIFKKRGFSASQVHALLQDSAHISLGPRDLLDRYATLLAKMYGTSVNKVKNGPAAGPLWAYDMETGYPLHAASPQEFARNLSTCYQADKYWKSCKLNFHQELGCRMTKSWQIICRAYLDPGTDGMIGDLCFWEPRGDLPVLVGGGYKNEKSVMLPGAKPAGKTAKKKVAQSKVPYCKDEGPHSWRDFMRSSRRNGKTIPSGLKF